MTIRTRDCTSAPKGRVAASSPQDLGMTLSAYRKRGGTIINALFALIFLGLLFLGIWWAMKQFGQATQEYGQAMVNASNQASAIKCESNMRSIYQFLQMEVTVNGEFPASQGELVAACGTEAIFRCSEPNAPTYVYIPGQRFDVPPSNVLVYEPEPVHNGKCTVLFAGGQIAMLTPEELKLGHRGDEGESSLRASLQHNAALPPLFGKGLVAQFHATLERVADDNGRVRHFQHCHEMVDQKRVLDHDNDRLDPLQLVDSPERRSPAIDAVFAGNGSTQAVGRRAGHTRGNGRQSPACLRRRLSPSPRRAVTAAAGPQV